MMSYLKRALLALLAISLALPAVAQDTGPGDAAYVNSLVLQGPPYPGQVATRTRPNNYYSTSLKQAMCRRADWMRDSVTSFTPILGNFYTTANAENNPGGPTTYTMDIEYPAGTYTRVTFGGANSIVATDGQAQVLADPVILTIPRNAQFWTNVWESNATGIMMSQYGYRSTIGDKVSYGVTVTDATMGSWTGTGSGFTCGAMAIIAQTKRPSIALYGDSEVTGVGEANAAVAGAAYVGVLAPSLATNFAVLDLSQPSAQAAQIPANFAKRGTYLQYVTHVVNELGTNDLANNPTVAQFQSYDAAAKALAPTKAWLRTTLLPRTNSTVAISSLTSSTTTATAVIPTTQAATLKVGQTVTIAGATPSGYNGAVVITAIAGTSISYTLLAGGSGLASASPTGTMSDGWASLAFQTVTGLETLRVSYDEAIRSGTVGYVGYFDIADGVESSRNSGLIKTPNPTQVPSVISLDGLHFNLSGWSLITPYIDPMKIKRDGTVVNMLDYRDIPGAPANDNMRKTLVG